MKDCNIYGKRENVRGSGPLVCSSHFAWRSPRGKTTHVTLHQPHRRRRWLRQCSLAHTRSHTASSSHTSSRRRTELDGVTENVAMSTQKQQKRSHEPTSQNPTQTVLPTVTPRHFTRESTDEHESPTTIVNTHSYRLWGLGGRRSACELACVFGRGIAMDKCKSAPHQGHDFLKAYAFPRAFQNARGRRVFKSDSDPSRRRVDGVAPKSAGGSTWNAGRDSSERARNRQTLRGHLWERGRRVFRAPESAQYVW